MKIKLLIKKIKYKIVKFLYNYFKKIYIRNINIDDNEILQYAHNELTIYGYNYETDKGYMPKPKRIIPCVEVEIFS